MWTAFVTSEKKKKKKSLFEFFFPSPPSLSSLSSLPPSSASSAAWAQRPGCDFFFQPLWRSNEEQAAVAPLTPGLVWDAVTAVCFPLGSYLYISRENKQYIADLADPSIGCKQVGEAFVSLLRKNDLRWSRWGNTALLHLFYCNGLFNIYIFYF